MRAAPGRASAAPRMIARLSRQIGIASLNMTGERSIPALLVTKQSQNTMNSTLNSI
jgi:hypothetical protein